MKAFEKYEVWFITGSQHLYGEGPIKQVESDAQGIVKGLNDSSHIPVNIVPKPVLTTPESIHSLCLEANADKKCIGLIAWMHTFSPAKMWIAGLKTLAKPLLHLHTQFNRDIPWSSIDMDFMNLNQSAHGGREFGFMLSRMRKPRKVVAGHWQDEEVLSRVGIWTRAATALADTREMKIARFGDNMRNVAVTEGDKVAAQAQLGYAVFGYGVGDLAEKVNGVTDAQIEQLVKEYQNQYKLADSILNDASQKKRLTDAAKIELGMKQFLDEGNFKAFTTTFEDLHGLPQLPGLAVQRLMEQGYGFGAEGDWKTAALVRAMKIMGEGLEGGTSFMEDYTYHFDDNNKKVLGAHMLEVCESIAAHKPSLEIHPLSIGDKSDPVRLVFNSEVGPAVNASIIDLGDRFRLITNQVRSVEPAQSLPQLPVARVVWKPEPDLRQAAAAWILAGGAHHAGFSQAVTTDHLRDFAEIADIEYLQIDKDTEVDEFKKELKWNQVYYNSN